MALYESERQELIARARRLVGEGAVKEAREVVQETKALDENVLVLESLADRLK